MSRAPGARSSPAPRAPKARSSRAVLGQLAETIVADHLFARGYAILARNLRLGPLEIDLVARKGALVAVVEVRTRGAGSFLPALGTLSLTKRARLLRAADRLWQSRFARAADVERLRIDVAAVYFGEGAPRVEYLEGAVSHEDGSG